MNRRAFIEWVFKVWVLSWPILPLFFRKPEPPKPKGTLSHGDLLDMMAALGENGYQPTSVILHPMAWAAWRNDPVLQKQLLTGP
jgi:hypothetical protein